MTNYRSVATCATLLVLAATATTTTSAQQISITIENLQPAADGFFLTPVWIGFHDGSFDLYDGGSVASPGLQLIAEDGDPSTLRSEFAAATNGDATARHDDVVFAPGGFSGAPVLDAGESVTRFLTVPNSASNRYFSFASMVIPSNDAFIGNGNPLAYPIFDLSGASTGPLTIDLFGADIHDAGTEVNDAMGAAFSLLGGTRSDEGGTVIPVHPGLDNFVGTGTPAGTIGTAIAANEPVARITIRAVPEPHTAALLLAATVAGVSSRHRKLRPNRTP
jgi:hypothetical protein